MTIKLGIWCDYGVTLEPSEGIGVFVANLVQGLAEQPAISRIVLVAKQNEEHLLDPLRRLDPQRIDVVSKAKPPFYLRKPWKILRQADRRALEQTGVGLQPRSLRGVLYRWLTEQVNRSRARWLEEVDLWLLPYVGLEQEFTKPTVVIVHDLVTYHFTEGIAAKDLADFKRLVDRVTQRAKIVACMSDFILHNDLLGTLGLPLSKTRMVRPTVPRDFACSSRASGGIPQHIPAGNFLLYPAAFRSYKNHGLLVSGLPALNRDREVPLHLVFTGITQTPEHLQRLIDELGIRSWVHVLGKVSRAALELLYRHAFATAVPSLYEQGSFPLMEALAFGCPILASDIPSLREQLAAMGDDAIFFDPRSADSFVQAVRLLEHDRGGRLAGQLAGFERMKQRTWADVAKEWCDVFAQAVEPRPGSA